MAWSRLLPSVEFGIGLALHSVSTLCDTLSTCLGVVESRRVRTIAFPRETRVREFFFHLSHLNNNRSGVFSICFFAFLTKSAFSRVCVLELDFPRRKTHLNFVSTTLFGIFSLWMPLHLSGLHIVGVRSMVMVLRVSWPDNISLAVWYQVLSVLVSP